MSDYFDNPPADPSEEEVKRIKRERAARELMDRSYDRSANNREEPAKAIKKAEEVYKRFMSRGASGGGGMSPADIEKVPGKRPLKMKKGGMVKSSASKRADGCAVKGKTRGRMV